MINDTSTMNASSPNQDESKMPIQAIERSDTTISLSEFVNKVYAWMSVGLSITGSAAYFTANDTELMKFVLVHFWVLCIVQLVAVVWLSGWVNKMTAQIASVVFLLYSGMVGFTLSLIFIVYEIGSIEEVFFITAAMFCVICVYGHTTKRDLTELGQVAFMGLVGLILASIWNLYNHYDAVDLALSYIGVVVFTALTAYDAQKIKAMYVTAYSGGDESERKEAIVGALALYLDFINIFLKLLRIFGRSR